MTDKLHPILTRFQFEAELIDQIETLGRLKKADAGDVVVSPGETSREMPIVLAGLLKLMKQGEDGAEVFLYFLESGQVCAMSITCCLLEKQNNFKLIADRDSQMWMVPIAHLDQWIEKYPAFRKFVFQSYQNRFDELLESIEAISFMRMDERLYKYLLDKKQATGSYVINQTHQEIARELNTSRVVISRLLKQLERQDKIEQSRNRIEVL